MAINNDSLYETMVKWLAKYQRDNQCPTEVAIKALGELTFGNSVETVASFHLDLMEGLATVVNTPPVAKDLKLTTWIDVWETQALGKAKSVKVRVIGDDELPITNDGSPLAPSLLEAGWTQPVLLIKPKVLDAPAEYAKDVVKDTTLNSKDPVLVELVDHLDKEIFMHNAVLKDLKTAATLGSPESLDFYIKTIKEELDKIKELLKLEEHATPDTVYVYQYHKERLNKLQELLEEYAKPKPMV